MATRATLRTRLEARLGLGAVSPVEQTRLNEALNAAISRALSDGAPGLTYRSFVGSVRGSLTLNAADTVVGSASVALDGSDTIVTDDVYPQDIFYFDSDKYLISEVTSETALSIGIPALATAPASTATVYRRALPLPSTGQVLRVGILSGDSVKWLQRLDHLGRLEPFEIGSTRYYEQRFSEGQSSSYLTLWPAPASTDRFVVQQSAFKVQMDQDSDTLDFPEEALDAILERARGAYLTWIGSADGTQLGAAERANRDVADSLENSGAAFQGYQRV